MKNQSIEGFSTIIQALVKESKNNVKGLGRDKVEDALIGQWLEYAALYVNYADLPANARRIFKVVTTNR